MAKPSIQPIQVTQTFQNWFDKTNELVALFETDVITATSSGDLTIGNANLQGTFQANTVVADVVLEFDNAASFTSGGTINFNSPIQINGTTSKVVSTLNYGSGGPQVRYTDGTLSWDVGFEDSTNRNFIINTGLGETKFELSPAGTLTVPNLSVIENFSLTGDIEGNAATFTGDVNANNVISSTLVTGTASITNITATKITGDIYHPDEAGGNGSGKVLENGGPAANIPATFWGNVNGTVSSLTNHDTDNLGEGESNLYFSNQRVRDSLVAGTGVGIIADPTDSTKTQINIGQNVASTSGVKFKSITLWNGNTTTPNDRISLSGVNGTIVAEGDITAFGSVSDITRKENIEPIENALDKVSKLGGYTFNYIDRPNDPMTGVIAQELLEVLPEAVYKTTDKDGHDIYAVRHGNIVGLLIEAIKELKEKVDSK